MVLFGPPAVGKMTVGRAVCEHTQFRLFLNHHTIEPLADVFGMGSAPFRALTSEFRHRVVQEAAEADVALMLTLVWNLGGTEDERWMRELVSPYANAGLPISFVELAADLTTRLARNRGEDRLLAKPSKRGFDWSEAHIRDREQWVMNTDPSLELAADALLGSHRHLRLDNQLSDPQDTARQIVAWHSPPGTQAATV